MKLLKRALVILLMATVVASAGCAANDASTQQQTLSYGDGVGAVGGATMESPIKSEDRGVSNEVATPHGTAATDVTSDGYQSNAGVAIEPMIIRSASLEVRVKDVASAVDKLRAAVLAHGGEIADLSMSGGNDGIPLGVEGRASDGPTYASVTVRVPATKLDALSDTLAKLGTVVSQSESASDVTEQAIDMEARLKNLRAEEVRLRSFLDRTNKVSELLAVESELARVRGEIESMDAQLTYLKRQVAKATLMVTLSEPGPVTGTESPWYGLRQAFSRGVQGAIQVVETLITLVVGALPLLIVIGGLTWALIAGLRRRHARRVASSSEAADASVGDVDEEVSE